jgi:hypothetical protein
VVYPLAEGIQEYLAAFEVILWEHFPGIITGVIWSILSFFATTLFSGYTITLPTTLKSSKEAKNSSNHYSLEDLKAFASKMLRIRLNSKYLHQFDEAKNKDEFCNKLVDEVIKANPPKPK